MPATISYLPVDRLRPLESTGAATPSLAAEDSSTSKPTPLRKPTISFSRRGSTQSENSSPRVWTTNSVHITRLQNCNTLPHTHPRILDKKVHSTPIWREIPYPARVSKSRERRESAQGAAYFSARYSPKAAAMKIGTAGRRMRHACLTSTFFNFRQRSGHFIHQRQHVVVITRCDQTPTLDLGFHAQQARPGVIFPFLFAQIKRAKSS